MEIPSSGLQEGRIASVHKGQSLRRERVQGRQYRCRRWNQCYAGESVATHCAGAARGSDAAVAFCGGGLQVTDRRPLGTRDNAAPQLASRNLHLRWLRGSTSACRRARCHWSRDSKARGAPSSRALSTPLRGSAPSAPGCAACPDRTSRFGNCKSPIPRRTEGERPLRSEGPPRETPCRTGSRDRW